MTHPFASVDEATNWAISWLADRGYKVAAGLVHYRPISPEDLRKRYAPSLSSGGLSQRLNHPRCPEFSATRSSGGRLLTVVPNPALIAWIRFACARRRRRELSST